MIFIREKSDTRNNVESGIYCKDLTLCNCGVGLYRLRLNFSKRQKIEKDREAWPAALCGVAKNQTPVSTEQQQLPPPLEQAARKEPSCEVGEEGKAKLEPRKMETRVPLTASGINLRLYVP